MSSGFMTPRCKRATAWFDRAVRTWVIALFAALPVIPIAQALGPSGGRILGVAFGSAMGLLFAIAIALGVTVAVLSRPAAVDRWIEEYIADGMARLERHLADQSTA